MIKGKVTKIFAACMMTAVLFGSANMDVHAVTSSETLRETEPNDTKETAELIKANNETAKGYLAGSSAGRFVVNGDTSVSDPDWYKVYLSAGTHYMTCYIEPFSFTIEDEFGNIMIADSYTLADTTRFGRTAYEFRVQKEGYYYVKILGSDSSSRQYEFTVGSPTYSIDTCKISCKEGNINMTAGSGTKVVHFDGKTVSSIPKDAVVNYVNLDVKGLSIKSAKLINEESGKSVSLDSYPFRRDDVISMNMPADSMWTAELKHSKNKSFTPVLTVQYVYPIYHTENE